MFIVFSRTFTPGTITTMTPFGEEIAASDENLAGTHHAGLHA
jgi:hypothetical protein